MKASSRHLDMNYLASLCSKELSPLLPSLGIWRAAAPSLPPRLLSQHCAVLWPDGLSLLPGWHATLETLHPHLHKACVLDSSLGIAGDLTMIQTLITFFFFFLIASVTAKHISFRAEEEKMSLKPDKMVSLWLASFIWWKISLVMLVLLAVFPLTPVISQHELETISETSFLTLHHFPPQKDIYFFCSRSLGSAISMFSCIHSILCACDTLLCLWVFRVWKPAVICKHVFRIGKWGGVGSKHFTACCAEKI